MGGVVVSQRARTWCIAGFSLALGAVAALLLSLLGGLEALDDWPLPWWTLVPLFTAAELVVVHVQARRESLSVSFAEIPLVLGLVFATPVELLAASVLGSLLGLLHRRQSGLKLAFNTCLFALEASLAATTYHLLLAQADPLSARGLLSALATVVITDLVSAAALTVVVWLKVGELDDGVLREAVSSGLVAATTNASVGLLVVVLVVRAPLGVVLLLVVLAVLALAYRAYSSLSQGHARLESLHRFTQQVSRQVGSAAVSQTVLRQARDALSADHADLVVLDDEARPRSRLHLDRDGQVREADLPARPWWAPAQRGAPVREDALPALAAPLHVGGRVVAVLAVTGRPHHLGGFTDDELQLLGSLANHAAVSLHNARLVDTVRREAAAQEHLSLHDALTGLPNRRHLLAALEGQLRRDACATVVVVDVDGFTEVNDALGHAAGDALLRETGRRLVHAVPGPGRVARLGNDEFAVLLDPSHARSDHRQVQQLLEQVCGSFAFEQVTLEVRLSTGLATGGAPRSTEEVGARAAELLQHADTAMYLAKRERARLRVWQPQDATDSSRRLALVNDLRASISAGELEVHYQPTVDLASARPRGAEALVRWRHAQHGPVSPEEFIPLAEQTGLVEPLTSFVLATALADCARWRQRRPHFRVSVNLSARSLLDQSLPSRVAHALTRAELPGQALVLEITETAVMGDLDRALTVLHGLRRLGVALSIDDFGTGQSSLAYVKQLPVDELKIDRSFVTAMATDSGDAAIVRTAVDLAHVLGLSVVAEGVEDAATMQLLAEMGCDAVQGYHVSRPQPAHTLTAWLARPVPGPRRPPPSPRPRETVRDALDGTRDAPHRGCTPRIVG